MSDFRIVENNDRFFVVDLGGHSLGTHHTEEEARARVEELDEQVKQRIRVSKEAQRAAKVKALQRELDRV